MERLKQLIMELSDLPGNVGYEDQVIQYLLDSLGEEKQVSLDILGNLTVHLTPKNIGKQRVMLFGHMDEVGMMVNHIDKNGFIYCEKLGSLNPTCLAGLKLELHGEKGSVNGVVGVKSHHLAKQKEGKIPENARDYYLDVGALSRDEVLDAGIDIGSPVTFKPQFLQLYGNCIANKAMDDRALLGILLYLTENLAIEKLDVDLYLVFSVQEEFNTRGIMPTVREIHPDIVIGLDVTPATDTPDLSGLSEIKLGKGPALTFMNHHSRGTLAGIVPNKRFLTYLETMGERAGIPIQREVATGILTETAYIAIENNQTVVANISLPTRYTHSPVEVIHLEDALGIYQLLAEFLLSLDGTQKFGKNSDFERNDNK
ncbi:M42 family metallopeptidase [Candidatus Enterococcus murrayae]|uniref:M42 family peptidase n=1 Tax=Candidatus Enterococcus murrayae TaxID=2815321 RepID=A0ABS3HEH8_9ENTE|nr:M42 family peptidase [Enterococcus sp. MJM16]MBO0451852.1 M42 family peptidase [Enterococcus sp. MJM16]